MAQTAIKTTEIVTEEPRIVAVNPTKNKDWVQLVVRCEREKKNNSSNLEASIFSAGNLNTNVEKLIAWRSVHVDFLEAYGIDYDPVNGQITDPSGYTLMTGMERVNDNESIPESFPECKIWVNETFKQIVSTDGTYIQKPKINPATNAVLCNQGKPIYLNRELTFDMTKEDVYISHDNTSPNEVVSDSSSPFGELDA